MDASRELVDRGVAVAERPDGAADAAAARDVEARLAELQRLAAAARE